MLKVYPAVCVKANHAFNAHIAGVSAKYRVGITLFVSKQGLRGPQIADRQQWMPTFFVMWLT